MESFRPVKATSIFLVKSICRIGVWRFVLANACIHCLWTNPSFGTKLEPLKVSFVRCSIQEGRILQANETCPPHQNCGGGNHATKFLVYLLRKNLFIYLASRTRILYDKFQQQVTKHREKWGRGILLTLWQFRGTACAE